MSDGTVGYCLLVGFRNREAQVRVDFACGEFAPAPPASAATGTAATPRIDRLGAFAGCLVGLAVGDALGYPGEFRTRAQMREAFGPLGVTDLVGIADPRWPAMPRIGADHPAGSVSDDTQMTVATTTALVAAGHLPLDQTMAKLADEYVAWSQSQANDRGPGAACMAACDRLAKGAPWRTAGAPDAKGAGSVMRAAPIGLYHWRRVDTLLAVADASARLTHGHPTAVVATQAAAWLVAMALGKRTPAAMHAAIDARLAPADGDFARLWQRIPTLLAEPPEVALRPAAEGGLGHGWIAEEAVAAAFYCFWRAPLDFRATVLAAANTDGDSDTLACVAGGLAGAFNGEGAIPAAWRDKVEGRDALQRLARELWESSGTVRAD